MWKTLNYGQNATIDVGQFLHELIDILDLPSDVAVVLGDNWPSIDAKHSLLRQIFQNILNQLYIVKDSEECLDFLHQREKYRDPETAPRPGILQNH